MQFFSNLKNKVYCYLTFYSLFAKMGKVYNILSDKDKDEINLMICWLQSN